MSEITPVPDGGFSKRQWRSLRQDERDFYRNQKKDRDREAFLNSRPSIRRSILRGEERKAKISANPIFRYGLKPGEPCACPVAGFCSKFNRAMPDALWKICQGSDVTEAQRAVFLKNWSRLANDVRPSGVLAIKTTEKGARDGVLVARPPCIHQGQKLRDEKCKFCSLRDKAIPVYTCAIWQECSVSPYRAGQPIPDCKSCRQYTPVPTPYFFTDPVTGINHEPHE